MCFAVLHCLAEITHLCYQSAESLLQLTRAELCLLLCIGLFKGPTEVQLSRFLISTSGFFATMVRKS